MEPSTPSPRSILVVEDDEALRDVLASLFEDEGFEVATAGNGAEALEYLHENEPPGVILLDLVMPVMDGMQFREEQRQYPELAEIPVVVYTGLDGADEAESVGAAAYLQKPLPLGILLDTVKRHYR